MNYSGYMLALQLFVILVSSTYYCQGLLFSDIENLKNYFNASNSDVANGGPLFLDILKNWKEDSDRRIIQGQVISFYLRLFDNFKDNQAIQKNIDNIREDMTVKFFNSSYSKSSDFQKLATIAVDDLKVQRKAINELFKVIDDLSPKSSLRKRKRSQNQIRGRRASK